MQQLPLFTLVVKKSESLSNLSGQSMFVAELRNWEGELCDLIPLKALDVSLYQTWEEFYGLQ